jgi:uncharacterized protein YajQ (UPF0234 family)
MRLSFLIVLLFLIISGSSHAQSTIRGTVVNKENSPLEFVTISLKKDSLVKATSFTDSIGSYEYRNVSSGIYTLLVSRLDYEKVSITINITRDTIINIQLPDNAKQLKEVVVAGKTPLIERKIDRMVFNVENSIATSGGDALDALKITPGVRVQDNLIGMVGKSGIAVMVDDRVLQLTGEDLVNFLSTIKSDNIKSIEVITNPPAKYDAEGNGGMINIKLKKAKANSWNGALLTSYTQTTYPAGNIGGNFNYQKDKLSFIFNIDYKRGARKRTESDELYYPKQSWNTDFVKKININNTAVNAGIDYQVTKKWTTGIQYSGTYSRPVIDEKDAGVITGNETNLVDSFINTIAVTRRKVNSSSLNWHSDIDLNKNNSKLFMNFDYFDFANNTNRDFSTENQTGEHVPTPGGFMSTNNIGVQGLRNYTGKVDLEMPLEWIKLMYGAKVSFTTTNNDLKYYNTTSGTPILNTDQSNIFNYKENTTALYISGDKKFGKKWQAQAGLRMESTHTQGTSVTYSKENRNNYVQLFPTGFISYAPNDDHSIVVDYGRRITRPGYASLNPFKFYSSPYSYTEGNPFLTPKYADNIEIKYGYKNTLYTTFYFSKDIHGFGEVPFADEITKVQYFTQLNYFSNKTAGFSESFSFNRLKWWESETKVDVYYSASSFIKEVNLRNTESWGCYVSSNNSFILNNAKTVRGAINVWYQAPEYSLLYKNKSRANLDLALKYSLLKNSVQLAFIVQDILRTARNYSTTNTNGIRQVYYDYSDNRFFRISLAYKFGNKKINIEKRTFGNEEEKGRANN